MRIPLVEAACSDDAESEELSMNIDDIAFIAADMEVEQEYENAQRLEVDAEERMLLDEEDMLSNMSETSEMSFDDTNLISKRCCSGETRARCHSGQPVSE